MPNAAIKLHAFTEGHSVESLSGREILADTPESGLPRPTPNPPPFNPEFNSGAHPETARRPAELDPPPIVRLWRLVSYRNRQGMFDS
jgi:hypothetical protein